MLTAAVIGCGRGGTLSLEALHESKRFEAVAASDPSAQARDDTRRRFPRLRLFADHREMLAENPADVVCIASPAPSHVAIARDVLRHRPRGLLLEKPLACNTDEAARLLTEIRDLRLPVVVPHGMLVLPAAGEVKQRIRNGAIGTLRSIEVQNAVDLLNAGIHWLVFLMDLLHDDTVQTVQASFETDDHIVNDGVQVESRGRTELTMGSGLNIVLHSGIRTKPVSNELPDHECLGALFEVSGSSGKAVFSAWAGSYWIATADEPVGKLVRCGTAADPSYHQVFLDELARGIEQRTPDYRSAELSLGALRLIETAYRGHDSDGWRLGAPVSA